MFGTRFNCLSHRRKSPIIRKAAPACFQKEKATSTRFLVGYYTGKILHIRAIDLPPVNPNKDPAMLNCGKSQFSRDESLLF